jgi:hypothetical protein
MEEKIVRAQMFEAWFAVANAQFVKDSHAKNMAIAFAMPFSMIETDRIVNWPGAVFYVRFKSE